MGKLGYDIGHLGTDGSTADPGNKAGIWGADDEIRADATALAAGTLDLAKEDADDGEDHRHLNGDRENADGRA